MLVIRHVDWTWFNYWFLQTESNAFKKSHNRKLYVHVKKFAWLNSVNVFWNLLHSFGPVNLSKYNTITYNTEVENDVLLKQSCSTWNEIKLRRFTSQPQIKNRNYVTHPNNNNKLKKMHWKAFREFWIGHSANYFSTKLDKRDQRYVI